MDLRYGSKRIKAIYKGNTPVPGLMVNGRLWHGSAGSITKDYYTDNTMSELASSVKMDKVYYSTWITDNQKCKLNVNSGGKLLGYTTVYGQNMFCCINSGGSASQAQVQSDAGMQVFSGSFVSDCNVASGGYLLAYGYGYAHDVTCWSNGRAYAANRGILDSISLSEPGAYLEVDSGGSALNAGTWSNTTIHVMSSGYISKAHIQCPGGIAYVHNGGTMLDARIEKLYSDTQGGTVIVESGGSVSGVIVSSGGTLTVASGGRASAVTSQTGAVIISSAGAAIHYT